MKKSNILKGFIIDGIVSFLIVVLYVCFTRYVNENFECSRVVYLLIMFILAPTIWITLVLSLKGKKTIGQTIIRKISSRKKENEDIDSK